MSQSETISGVVSEVAFRNEDNGYSVIKVSTGTALVTCVGTMPTLERGESVMLTGSQSTHLKFGAQFVVDKYEIVPPSTPDAIVSFLSSGIIASIGEVRARRIVDHFGENTLSILDTDIGRLREIEGIGKKTLDRIQEGWNRQKAMRNLVLFCHHLGISAGLAARIHAAYGESAQEIISKDPFELVKDIWGVGFKRADAIASHMGFAPNSFKRIRAGLIHVVREALGDGHLFLLRQEVLDTAVELLGIELDPIIQTLDHLCVNTDLMLEGNAVYLPSSLTVEKNVADLLKDRITAVTLQEHRFTDEEIDSWIAKYMQEHAWQGDPIQISAVKSAIRDPLLLLTGGPGTGKTTTLTVIVAFFRTHNMMVAMAAPTGRAAQRMGSVAGLQAQTLHRLLEFKPTKHGFTFNRCDTNPIPADVVIVDEVSMVDIFLMRALLSAVAPRTRLILVGDHQQLPSVGPGAVLWECIASKKIPHIHLSAIFRQAALSAIVRTAHAMLHGTVPAFANSKTDDCFYLHENNPVHCRDLILDLVGNRLPSTYGFNPITDIQVLAPMHKGELGTRNLNKLLQERLNPGTRKLTKGDKTFALGDKVMQIRNNYDAGVFNGDIGFIADIVDEESLIVAFDDRRIPYDWRSLDELTHAYCISIHKSQGCEFPAVVIVLATQHYIMLQRNLVYTALTRARKLCVFVGSHQALALAVKNESALNRNTHLAARIEQA